MTGQKDIDLYEHFDQLRSIIPESEHALFGLGPDRVKEEKMRAHAMRQLVEDENRSDSETIFYFMGREDALLVYKESLDLGLVQGEVTFDSTVDESYGVGKYALRFAPHVRDGKREILYKLFEMAHSARVEKIEPSMFEAWLEETDGGALVVEQGQIMGGQASGAPVHGLTQPEMGRKVPSDPKHKALSDQARKRFAGAAGQTLGDFVLNSKTGTPGPEGGSASVHGVGGAARSEGDEPSSDNSLVEDLKQIGGGGTSIEELRSLIAE